MSLSESFRRAHTLCTFKLFFKYWNWFKNMCSLKLWVWGFDNIRKHQKFRGTSSVVEFAKELTHEIYMYHSYKYQLFTRGLKNQSIPSKICRYKMEASFRKSWWDIIYKFSQNYEGSGAKTTPTFTPVFSTSITPKVVTFSKNCTWPYFKTYL